MNLSPPASAFDAIAPVFDARFGVWESVAAQRRAVRETLLQLYPVGSRLFEIGGGTGEDASWLAARGYNVLMTDASPAMVGIATDKLRQYPSARTEILPAESLDAFAMRYIANGGTPLDGVYSNFAALNCVTELRRPALGMARLIQPGGAAALVIFGIVSPGDSIVELVRGRPRGAVRRWQAGSLSARLGGRAFNIVYHRKRSIVEAMSPWFRLERRLGIGVFVPPSAAEPWISRHPRILASMEALDNRLRSPLAFLGDHILYQFRRTAAPA